MWRILWLVLCVRADLLGSAKSFNLYGYGYGDVEGWNVIYANGLAWISNGTIPVNSTDATNVTFTLGPQQELKASPDKNTSSGVTWDTGPKCLYLVPTENKITQMGFVGDGDTAPADAQTTNWMFYGRILMWSDPSASDAEGNIKAPYWIEETKQAGLWKILWNVPNANLSNAAPVVIKTEPPWA